MPTDTAKHTQTAPVSVLGCLGLAFCVCWCLLSSVGISGFLRCLGGVWGDAWGVVKEYLSGIHGNWSCLDVVWGYLGS